ncbi:hypothetical protein HNY73_009132 [Argiope bruennichi]|uniref:Uncharacterized protein n=1 Tax=Argiope bruennichi TaxID=94029 RepID=A0A8T0FDR2_ARGBR|nr:hypothetical protein HNY73_009132 [Argiope bruennichi]
MEKGCPKRSLHEEANSSSSDESSPSPTKQLHIRKYAVLNLSPKESSTSTTSFKPEIHGNVSERASTSGNESYGLQLLSTEASKKEHIKKYEPQGAVGGLVSKDWGTESEEDSPEDAPANALKREYMKKYASEYSKELLFAVDVMTLARHLNQLPCKWIIYVTGGKPPKSPCDDVLEEALGILWAETKDDLAEIFKLQLKFKRIDYALFQKMVLHMAQKAEQKLYDERSFLFYCMSLAHWAVFAELSGVTDAPEFVPLVICRTIQKLKDSGKLPVNFWERIAETALDITTGTEK